jgi:hypothetical protein
MAIFKDTIMIKDRPFDRAVQVIVIAITLSACGWGAYYNETGMGDGDWWLEQRGISETNKWYKIALVFGTVDDYQACIDIAKERGQEFSA